MKFILQAGNWFREWSTIEKAVPEADQLGFWGFVMPDHYMWGSNRGGNSTLEAWIALTFLAAKTEKIRLGTVVTPIPFRPPGMMAKEISTIDLLSKGRAVLGVGAGWSQTEFDGYSKWEEPRVRVDKTIEGVDLILELWTSKHSVNFKGKYYEALGAVLEPKPLQKPHPPLLFGGVGRRMLNVAGKYADICLVPSWTRLGLSKSREIVKESAKRYLREDQISFASISFSRDGYDQRVIEKEISVSKDGGDEYFIIGFPKDRYIETMHEFAKNIMPSF
ncbi:MAG: LLM class flavin-dependent oxidoreductase [Thaumarchaeota archaeon]|nr:LLM class flavin-dependent oxidoreductase [Nitrososphaerota archaeon]